MSSTRSSLDAAPVRHAFEAGLYLRERPGAVGADPLGTVLLIHGLGESGLCFEDWLASGPLPGWRLLAPDLPGYGRTPRRETPASLEAQADLLARWLVEQGGAPAALVGHSMGGVVAQLMAERHGDVVRAVVDVDGNITRGDCGYSGDVAPQPLGSFLGGGSAALLERVWTEGAGSAAGRGYYASMRLADPRLFHANSVELVARSSADDLGERLAALVVPTLFVAGVPDGVCRETLARLEQVGVATARVEPSGHWPFIDQPEHFTELLEEFLGALR